MVVPLVRIDSILKKNKKPALSIFKRNGLYCSSFNIQYQSTGVGSLSLLDKIELMMFTGFF